MLTKSTDGQAVEKPARQEGEPAKKGVYPVVNDRILRATPTQQAKISADAPSSAEIFAFAGFVSGLSPAPTGAGMRYASRAGHAA